MSNVLFTARKTVTDVLAATSASTTVITNAAEGLSLLSAKAQAHVSFTRTREALQRHHCELQSR